MVKINNLYTAILNDPNCAFNSYLVPDYYDEYDEILDELYSKIVCIDNQGFVLNENNKPISEMPSDDICVVYTNLHCKYGGNYATIDNKPLWYVVVNFGIKNSQIVKTIETKDLAKQLISSNDVYISRQEMDKIKDVASKNGIHF